MEQLAGHIAEDHRYVRIPWAILALGAGAATTLTAQRPWRAAVGIQGGYARLKPAGTEARDQADVWDLPGDGSSYTSMFAIIPVTRRFAIEPSLSAVQYTVGERTGLIPFTAGTNLGFTLRADLALVAGLYAGAGGTLSYVDAAQWHATQLGVTAALGYRFRLGGGMAARLEAQVLSMHRTDTLPPFNVYAVLLGLSARTGQAPLPSTDRPGRWRPALGMAGGYARTHAYGTAFGFSFTADQTLIALPGSGSTTPVTLYAIIPLRGRFALEPGLDAHRTQRGDTTSFDGHLSLRIDVALYGRWYAAVGGDARYLEATGSAGFALAGAHAAAGYRFPLIGDLDGRLEFSFTAFKERQNFPVAQNTLGVMVGLAMPLN